jgi:glycosyltransferase involved in cell wall biosynthesis
VRLLFVSNHAYLPQRVGGAEFSTHDLCQTLGRGGTDVAVLARLEPRGWPHLRSRLEKRLLQREATEDADLGYPVYRSRRPALALHEVLRRFNPDVAILHPDKAADLHDALRAARRPQLVYLRDAEFQRLGFTPVAGPGVGYVANSRFTAEAAKTEFGLEADAIPPLIIHERYLTKVRGDEVLFVNPVPEKGVEVALAIAAACPHRQFRFVESWPMGVSQRSALKQKLRALGNVELQPATQDMRPLYARARILIVPSRWKEAWGRIVTEAQLNGIPVLATRVGGLPESVGDGGELFEADATIDQWARAVERYFLDAEHHAQMSRRAGARARAFDLESSSLVTRLLAAAERVRAATSTPWTNAGVPDAAQSLPPPRD